MDIIYSLVKNSLAWTSDPYFHENFFGTHHAFLYGFLLALVIGCLLAAIFYFGFCNNKNSVAGATLSNWILFLIVSGGLTYIAADWAIIGKSSTESRTSMFYKYSFYNANELYYIEQTHGNTNEQFVTELSNLKNKISSDLDLGDDVRVPYSITTAVLALLFFYGFSLVFKVITQNGKTIPHIWPNQL